MMMYTFIMIDATLIIIIAKKKISLITSQPPRLAFLIQTETPHSTECSHLH